jgi:Putative auto-transporter adhesin, head GIN domain
MIATLIRKTTFAALLVLAAGSAAAMGSITGSGKMATEARSASGFTGIALALSGRVDLTQGDKESVSITADDNLLPEIETVVEGGVLKIRWRNRVNITHSTSIRIAVTARSIESLAVGGSGDIVSTALRARDLKVSIGGSGNVRLSSLSAAALSVSIGGSGDFSGEGSADSLSASVAGSGNIKAGRLAAQNVKVSVAGSGDATVWAKGDLNVSVAGSGDVKYYGDPAVKSAVVGSGSLKRLGTAPA